MRIIKELRERGLGSADCKGVSGEWRVTRYQGRTKRRGVLTTEDTEDTEMGRRGKEERDAVESPDKVGIFDRKSRPGRDLRSRNLCDLRLKVEGQAKRREI